MFILIKIYIYKILKNLHIFKNLKLKHIFYNSRIKYNFSLLLLAQENNGTGTSTFFCPFLLMLICRKYCYLYLCWDLLYDIK